MEVLDEEVDGTYISHDRHGVDFIGYDEESGAWWGTDAAVWVLSEQDGYIIVHGERYVGYFMGTEAEVRWYCATHCVTIQFLEHC